MSLIFYHSPYSTACVTHWVLEELGVPYEKVRLDLKANDQKRPSFVALNPNAKVPVVVHDGTPIFESIAITIYLGETFGVAKKLYPAPGPARGEALKWLVWCGVSLNGVHGRWQHNVSDRIPAEQRNAAAATAARAELDQLLGILDAHLGSRPWIVGDAFSLVDAHLASWTAYLQITGIDLEAWANLAAWHGKATARPGYATSMRP
jgi:glutathione S-transferase